MQIVRASIMLVGLSVFLAGLYLLAVGIGVPVAIDELELGPLKASIEGIGVGAVVAGFGLALIWLMTRWQRTTTVETGESYAFGGGSGAEGSGGSSESGFFRRTTIVHQKFDPPV